MSSTPTIPEEQDITELKQNRNSSHTKDLDLEGFFAELKELRQEIEENLGEADIKHLRKIENIGFLGTAIGTLTAWVAPNPLSAFALSIGRSTRWLMMHHIGHRGYDTVPGIPDRFTSKFFAMGIRRFIDWPDWMTPEAWKYEHNVLHHSHTGELADPDLVERNVGMFSNLPKSLRYAIFGFMALHWKSVYYAPSTLHEWNQRFLKDSEKRNDGKFDTDKILVDLLLKCYLPYTVLNFGIFPLLFAPLGIWSVFSATSNSIFAEALTNLHSFFTVVPNHAGDDLYRFDSKPGDKSDRYFRQILGTVNYDCGTDVVDFSHLWLNYQIEHHLWPDIPMLKYQQYQPQVKALCAKYNIPYLQDNLFKRIMKMVDVFVGNTTMKRLSSPTLLSEREGS